jgi:long-chain acyl-CoA synthetase
VALSLAPDVNKLVDPGLVPKDWATTTEADVIAFCKGRLAAYKYPREVRIVAELPKGSTGKILKKELR